MERRYGVIFTRDYLWGFDMLTQSMRRTEMLPIHSLICPFISQIILEEYFPSHFQRVGRTLIWEHISWCSFICHRKSSCHNWTYFFLKEVETRTHIRLEVTSNWGLCLLPRHTSYHKRQGSGGLFQLPERNRVTRKERNLKSMRT